ncbi:hypothetical protein LshimejAT787_1203520 [Lyophyllum shimeji]|uniref:Uncharacterized protein n=1 Tax=Lyophyllum shimeji TaxID=47721 RepID=A0A9P3PWJ6_LYOSH|nr:hypothetical protein LshimejAT787_1203520 [Lyophyllum shimeji]
MPNIPWASLKAETLRALCRDLGFTKYTTRDVMIDHLKRVEDQGLEKALARETSAGTPKKATRAVTASPAVATPSTAKRRLGTVVSDYNTRRKRVRISDPGPRPSRRTTLSARATPAQTTGRAATTTKRPRGRPPKKTTAITTTARTPRKRARTENGGASAPASARKEVFDGVVLPATRSGASKGKGKATEEEKMGEEDAEGEVEEDYDEGRTSRVESSLAGSDKENEYILGSDEANPRNTGQPVENGAAAAGTSTSGTIPESTVQIVTVVQVAGEDVEPEPEPGADADEDAEGEVVGESDDTAVMVTQGDGPTRHFPVLQEMHLESDLTPEDVSNIEQILRSVAADGLSGVPVRQEGE